MGKRTTREVAKRKEGFTDQRLQELEKRFLTVINAWKLPLGISKDVVMDWFNAQTPEEADRARDAVVASADLSPERAAAELDAMVQGLSPEAAKKVREGQRLSAQTPEDTLNGFLGFLDPLMDNIIRLRNGEPEVRVYRERSEKELEDERRWDEMKPRIDDVRKQLLEYFGSQGCEQAVLKGVLDDLGRFLAGIRAPYEFTYLTSFPKNILEELIKIRDYIENGEGPTVIDVHPDTKTPPLIIDTTFEE